MSETLAGLRRKMHSARDLHSVVRAMKAMASSNIARYEQSVRALRDYAHSVKQGLGVALKEAGKNAPQVPARNMRLKGVIGAIVFGSDQGLVGQFNEIIVDFAHASLAPLTRNPVVWVMGERAFARLEEAGLAPAGLFAVPNTVGAISPLVGQILARIEAMIGSGHEGEVHLYYNRHVSGPQYAPHHQLLLPLGKIRLQRLGERSWPTKVLPEIVGNSTRTLRALIREYLFVSLFRACAESLASENASRLAAMHRAEKNIDELLSSLSESFHRLRQDGIDEELFDVISGFEALR